MHKLTNEHPTYRRSRELQNTPPCLPCRELIDGATRARIIRETGRRIRRSAEEQGDASSSKRANRPPPQCAAESTGRSMRQETNRRIGASAFSRRFEIFRGMAEIHSQNKHKIRGPGVHLSKISF